MMKIFSFTILLMGLIPFTARSESQEDRLRMATDAAGPHLILENPAIANPDNFQLNYFHIQKSRETSVNFENNLTTPENKVSVKGTSHVLSFQNPIGGGASIGLLGEMTGEDHESEREDATNITTEKYRKKHGALRLATKITDTIRAAISLRYSRIDNDIAGNFFIQEDDRTKYSGTMTGFSTGIVYDTKEIVLGVGYAPPMRGKAKVSSEELIITEPGFINFDFVHGANQDFKIGAGLKKWLYKADDRQSEQTSPEEGNRISLLGVNHEQFLKATLAYSAGIDITLMSDYLFRLSASQTEYVFLFEENQVAGDDEDDETKFKAFGAKAMLTYGHDNFSFTGGYNHESRKTSSISPSQRWFTSEYTDYKSTDSSFTLAFQYRN